VNTICSQCGSVLASGEHKCSFCESPELTSYVSDEVSAQAEPVPKVRSHEEWRGELDQRLQAYRAKRRRSAPNEAQTALPFDDRGSDPPPRPVAIEVDEHPVRHPAVEADDFAFTIAIGRMANASEPTDPRMMIDVSVPPQLEPLEEHKAPGLPQAPEEDSSLYPIASLDDRRHAMLIDAACLAFAYGGFLALFGSLGGHFTLSKLSATVCLFTFAFVYIQYFGLFTVFGGSTPGMMVSGIHVASFTSDAPTPRQYMLRAVGYLLSAGTFFLGFLWVLWDEDGLTWHDRLSNTYLARIESFAEENASHPAATH
jgi:uncharacterized RDD family membrane protein YckC